MPLDYDPDRIAREWKEECRQSIKLRGWRAILSEDCSLCRQEVYIRVLLVVTACLSLYVAVARFVDARGVAVPVRCEAIESPCGESYVRR